jgi:hypothetical protein
MYEDEDAEMERHSVPYDLQLAASEDAELSRLLDWASRTYPRMLIEDVGTRVMPYYGYRDRSTHVKLEPEDDEVERLIAFALASRRDLTGAVFEFGRRCLANVVLFGTEAFEIVYGTGTSDQRGCQFSFAHIPPRSLDRGDGRGAVQHIPKLIANELHVPREIHVPQSRSVIFETPIRVRKQLPCILERLAALSEPTLPRFAIENLRPGAKSVEFNVKAFSRTRDLAIATAARDIGWSGRAIYLFGEQRVVEHYWWYREFAFERFLIELRDAFLSDLNQGLSKAGTECGFEGQLRLEGFPTLKEVDEAQRHLFAGDRSLTEINAAFRRQ